MFARRVKVERVSRGGEAQLCALRHIDNFAMRNFTNDAIFDDTLPIADGLLEIGNRVPLDVLMVAMEDWFRRKSYIARDEDLRITEIRDGENEPQIPADDNKGA